MWKASILWMILVALVGVLVAVLGHGPMTVWVLLNGLFFGACLCGALFVHTLGHACVARLVGLRVRRIDWLAGRVRFDTAGARPRRWQLALTALGGPLANATVATVALLVGGLSVSKLPVAPAFLELCLAGNALALITLVPFAPGGSASPGLLFLRCLRLQEADLAEHESSPELLDVELALEAGRADLARAAAQAGLARRPESVALRLAVANLDLGERRFREAHAGFRSLVGREPPAARTLGPILENNAAWAGLRSGDPTLLADADRLSASAHARQPGHPAIIGTRGSVLLRLGRLDEAEPLLDSSYLTQTDGKGRALAACEQARLAAARGDRVQAKAWLDKARAEDPGCDLLGETETLAG